MNISRQKIVMCGLISSALCIGYIQSAPTKQTKPANTQKNGNQSFGQYLETFSIPTEVATLAMIGVKKYADPKFPLKVARGSALSPKLAGGRSGQWIKETFGQEEDVIEDQLKKITAPPTWTIKDLDNAYTELTKKSKPSASSADFTLVKGFSVTYLNEVPRGKNSILQLASQFNYLESPGSFMVPVSDYPSDLTQGPLGSIEAAAAALHRTAAVKAGKLQHSLVNVLPAGYESYYQNGYLELKKYAGDMNQLKNQIQQNIKNLRILPEWVICEASGTKQLQVFSAAPSFQGYGAPAFNSAEAQICDLLVSAQYEVIGKLAVMYSIKKPKDPINVHLTLVGQGVFNNPPEVMQSSFKKIADIVKGYPNVHVFIHGYSPQDQNLVMQACKDIGTELKQMTVDEFVKA